MDERRLADYFVVAGLPKKPEILDDSDSGHLKGYTCKAPITDISKWILYIIRLILNWKRTTLKTNFRCNLNYI